MSSKCLFSDFDIGWAGSLHDANLWRRTAIGQLCAAGKLSLYALVGVVAYPCCLWMLAPYKGHKDGLTREEYHWNFVQSSIRMCIVQAFGMLKGRWKILLNKIDMHLKNVPKLVSTCLVIHNMCIVFGDDFWKTEWMQEAFEEVHYGLTHGRVSEPPSHERLVVANHALQILASIDETSRNTLEYMLHEATREFQIVMSINDKTYRMLSAR